MATLSITETSKLREYELIIDNGKKTFIEVSQALFNIHEQRLYRKDYDTFEEYCQLRHGFNRARGRQLIQHALTIDDTRKALVNNKTLDTIVSKMPEGQSRELAKVPVEHRAKVLETIYSNGPITAKSIAAAANVPCGTFPEPTDVYDFTGFAIPNPSPAMACWNRTAEAQDMLNALSRVKCAMEGAEQGRDSMYGEVNFSAILADLKSAYAMLKVAIPYAVCPTCQGRVLSPCTTCNGRGMVSEFFWNHKVPEKTKEIREKAVEAMLAKKGKL